MRASSRRMDSPASLSPILPNGPHCMHEIFFDQPDHARGPGPGAELPRALALEHGPLLQQGGGLLLSAGIWRGSSDSATRAQKPVYFSYPFVLTRRRIVQVADWGIPVSDPLSTWPASLRSNLLHAKQSRCINDKPIPLTRKAGNERQDTAAYLRPVRSALRAHSAVSGSRCDTRLKHAPSALYRV